ncbi:CopD family protein [Halorussus salinisoli]|uniref:CopD family protein n=1 Tax=Halorussus salinisoli TaxID=2558242 RepID=UPI0010C1F35B|nr:CopD family protein [Halorussus salinisoli]
MLAVRLLHVLGMALVLGGATLTWWLFRQDAASDSAAVRTAVAYERGFWAAIGVLVMTGVGNLGSLAPYVPTVETRWGTVFAAKLLLVLTVLALSLVRTLVVHRYRRAEATEGSGQETDTLRVAYGATALSLATVVALAEVLAHG